MTRITVAVLEADRDVRAPGRRDQRRARAAVRTARLFLIARHDGLFRHPPTDDETRLAIIDRSVSTVVFLVLRNEEELQMLQLVLARYRSLQPDRQQQLLALLQAIGQLQLQAGDRQAAVESFGRVSTMLTDRKELAEAHYHSYRAALDRCDLSKAMVSYHQANGLDPAAWTVERLRSEHPSSHHLATASRPGNRQQYQCHAYAYLL